MQRAPSKVGGPLFVLGLVLYFGGTFALGFVLLLLVYFQKFPKDLDLGVIWIFSTLVWWGVAIVLMIAGSLFLTKKKKEAEV
jgi:LPXTG-motif cell wall-anchored protein